MNDVLLGAVTLNEYCTDTEQIPFPQRTMGSLLLLQKRVYPTTSFTFHASSVYHSIILLQILYPYPLSSCQRD